MHTGIFGSFLWLCGPPRYKADAALRALPSAQASTPQVHHTHVPVVPAAAPCTEALNSSDLRPFSPTIDVKTPRVYARAHVVMYVQQLPVFQLASSAATPA